MTQRRIKIVIFDLDGTLVDAYGAVAESLNRSLVEMGYRVIPRGVIKKSVGWGEKILIGRFVAPEDVEKTLSLFRRYHRVDLKRGVKFLPGVKELIQKLYRQRFILAVASNRPSRFTEMILKILKARSFFRYVLCGDQVRRPKPASDILRVILRRASLKSFQALYVGDMTVDIKTGHAAGVRTIAVSTGSSLAKDMRVLKPYQLVDDIREVSRILKNLDAVNNQLNH